MKQRPKCLAIIPARKGSKRLPDKNIKPILGKPLIAWSIQQALACDYFDSVIVSTDSDKIANIAQAEGCSVPFMRPDSLATDASSTMDVVDHALKYFSERGNTFDIVAVIEPTSPLRDRRDLNNAMKLFLEHFDEYDAVISAGKLEREHPSIFKHINPNLELKPIQYDCSKELYFPYGVIYAVKCSKLNDKNTFYQDKSLAYKIKRWQNYEIDDEVDFTCVEALMNQYKEYL